MVKENFYSPFCQGPSGRGRFVGSFIPSGQISMVGPGPPPSYWADDSL